MKHCILSMLLCSSILGYATIFDTPAFKMPHTPMVELSKLHRNITISTDTSFLLELNNQISGIAISGRTVLENEEALVRVLLIDQNGKEYLVFEDIYMFPDEKEHVFTNVAMETAILENVNPKEIKIFIQNAQIELSQITGVLSDAKLSLFELKEQRKNILVAQEEYLIDRWNKLNAQIGQYWVAGKTSISGLPYSDKKIILGATDNHYLSDGIEYYVGGFFVIKSHSLDSVYISPSYSYETRDASSTYVESFDWRNRHGKNWMTSVKNQKVPYNESTGNGGCWAFGSLAALESRVGLYYNRLLNLDLSEQELGSCAAGSLHTGGNATQAYSYIQNNGISSESCFPFLNDETIPCSDKCTNPEYEVNITSFEDISSSEDVLKNELINHGPVASVMYTGPRKINHLMCLCGYGTIRVGSHVEYVVPYQGHTIDTIIPANSNLIGKTYWIYKNSFGVGAGIDGYLYAIYENENNRTHTTSLFYPVSISTLTNNDIVCEDADNDGYFFWGLGPKPTNCPICCPDIPDGDDSDPELAEMDNYGQFANYVFPYSTTTISSNTTWNSDTTHCGNIVVTDNAILTITAQLTMNPAAKIIVQNGGTLIVDTGSVVNANIDVQASARLHLLHNGTLYLKRFGNLNVRLGAEANMEYGCVLLQ